MPYIGIFSDSNPKLIFQSGIFPFSSSTYNDVSRAPSRQSLYAIKVKNRFYSLKIFDLFYINLKFKLDFSLSEPWFLAVMIL